VDAQGKPWQLSIDHGVPGLRGDEVWPAGLAEALHPWPAVQADGRADLRLAVAVPNMPALCQSLAEGLEVQLNTQVSGLHRDERGWTLSSAVRPLHRSFDAVVLAVPPPQAQALLSPHTAAPSPLHLLGERLPMQALWTLIAVIDGPVPAWDLARPADGPLALLLRNDRKPGRRTDDPGSTWVAHASAAWSTTHLEDCPTACRPRCSTRSGNCSVASPAGARCVCTAGVMRCPPVCRPCRPCSRCRRAGSRLQPGTPRCAWVPAAMPSAMPPAVAWRRLGSPVSSSQRPCWSGHAEPRAMPSLRQGLAGTGSMSACLIIHYPPKP
jgi:hypothetical protein